MIFNSMSGTAAYPIQLEGSMLHICPVSCIKCCNWCSWVMIHMQNKVQYWLRFIEAWYTIGIHPSPSQDEVAQMFLQCSKNHGTLQTLPIDIPNNGGKDSMIFNSTPGPTAYPTWLEGWMLHTCSVSPVKCWNQLPWIAIHIQTDMQY